MTPEMSSKVQAWRVKAAEGTLSLDEMKEAIKALRADRMGAGAQAQKTAATRKKAVAEIPSVDDMLADLG